MMATFAFVIVDCYLIFLIVSFNVAPFYDLWVGIISETSFVGPFSSIVKH